MGADSYKPPIGNVDLDGVFTIREYGDADAIRRYIIAGTRRAAVVGGGLLGLEAARHLRTPQLESLTIIEALPRLLPRQLDEVGARLLQRIIERLPATVLLGTQVAEFLGGRRVEGLRLQDGRELAVQTVLISAGIRPRIALARDAGLVANRGIVVDERLRSSDPDIFVAGDLVEYEGHIWGISLSSIGKVTLEPEARRAGGALRKIRPVPGGSIRLYPAGFQRESRLRQRPQR